MSGVDGGLELGYAFAAEHPGEHDRLVAIARAHAVSDVVDAVGSDAYRAAAESDPAGFWSGFAHGVRRYLLEQRHTLLADD
jgi:hypothetical protein